MAMWGVPSFTYANNCSRGLTCAVQMSLRVRTVNHTCSIGLTTGVVYCGVVGSYNRQDYVGIGDTVNLAARLMSKGEGKCHTIIYDVNTIFCDVNTIICDVNTITHYVTADCLLLFAKY